MVLLVAGGAGFIGANFIRFCLESEDGVAVVNLDALTYAATPGNLTEVADHPRYRFFKGDVARPEDVEAAFSLAESAFGAPVGAVVNFAAESHVDRSILDPAPFLRTNVLGTQVLLDGARAHRVGRYLQVSTDEVYGSLQPWEPPVTEERPLCPSSPYAASKAAADLLVGSYSRTYGLDAVITRGSNTYGPHQFPEKLIPLALCNAAAGEPVPVYGDGLNVRDWLYVDDHCRGIWAALTKGRAGEIYNLGGGCERTNLEVVRTLLRLLGRSEELIRRVADRPGHDRRYALDTRKAREELSWAPRTSLEDGLRRTVEWYLAHADWVQTARSGAYREYYRTMYAGRGAGT